MFSFEYNLYTKIAKDHVGLGFHILIFVVHEKSFVFKDYKKKRIALFRSRWFHSWIVYIADHFTSLIWQISVVQGTRTSKLKRKNG